MELDEQSWEELLTSELLPEQNHKQHAKQSTTLARDTYRVLRFAVSDWFNWKVKKHDDIDERNIRTSLYDSLIAFYKENYSYIWRSKTKINTTPVIRSSVTCNSKSNILAPRNNNI